MTRKIIYAAPETRSISIECMAMIAASNTYAKPMRHESSIGTFSKNNNFGTTGVSDF